MKELTEVEFAKAIEKGKVVVAFMREKGCSLCETMKPTLEQIEKLNPTITFYKYIVEGSTPDSVTKKYNFKTFPWIFTFEDGQNLTGTSGVVDTNDIILPFLDKSQLKVIAYDLDKQIKTLESMKNVLKAIDGIIAKKETPQQAKKEDDWDLGTSTALEPENCEGCQ